MLKWLKKHFIPHEGNNHQPYFLRSKNIRFLIAIVFAVEVGILSLPFLSALNPVGNNFLASVLPPVLDDLTNQNRQSQKLSVLAVNPVLNKVAELKAKDMAEKGYFAHTSPEGKAPWYWFKLAGYDYEYAGENLAVNFTDSQDVTLAWMNSPAHKENILKKVFTEIGTGVATGTYQGNATIFVVQVYGKPAAAKAISAPAKPIISVVPDLQSEIETESASGPSVIGESSDVAGIADYNENMIVLEKYLTSPKHAANIIFTIMGILVAAAIVFKLFIRMEKRHPVLITNGLIVIVLIFSAYAANNLIAKNKTASATSFASFQDEQFK